MVNAFHEIAFPFSLLFCNGCLSVGKLCCDSERKQCGIDDGVEDIVRNMKAVERAVLGFMCKQIIDMGRLMWMKERGLEAEFVKYVPSSVSPENHLLIGRCTNHS